MRVTSSLASVLAVWCGTTGWLVCEFSRFGRLETTIGTNRDSGAVHLAVLLAALAGTMMGWLLEGNTVRDSRLMKAFLLLMGLPLAGAVVGALVSLVLPVGFSAIRTGEGPLTGALGALAVAPVMTVMARTAAHVEQVRPGSLAFELHRRALWTLPCTAVAVGTLIAAIGNPHTRNYRLPPNSPLISIGVLACVALFATLMQQLATARFAKGVRKLATELRPHERSALADSLVARIDLGIGEQEYEHFQAAKNAYRETSSVLLIVRGDPERARSMAVRAACWTACGLTVSLVSTLVVTVAVLDS